MSTKPSRLRKIETIKNPSITILPIQTTKKKREKSFYKDPFLLEFTAFDKQFSLHLTPNFDLFHPDASVTVFNTDGTPNLIEKIRPHEYPVYKEYNQYQWARIILRNDIE